MVLISKKVKELLKEMAQTHKGVSEKLQRARPDLSSSKTEGFRIDAKNLEEIKRDLLDLQEKDRKLKAMCEESRSCLIFQR